MKQFALVLAFSVMITVNALANILPINGQTTGEISDRLQVPFTPAGYVFSIWGVIYLLLAIWLFLSFKNRHSVKAPPHHVTTLFITSCLLNAGWLLAFHYELFALSTIVMILLLLTLIIMHQSYPTSDNRFGGRLPFSFYLGWITVATVANITYTLKYHGVDLGISEINGTIALVIIAAAIGIIGRYVSNDPYFSIVFVWAIVGIAQANKGTTLEVVAYLVAIIIFIAIVVISFVPKNKQSRTA